MKIISKSATGTIIKAGLLAGTLDICSALLQFYIRTGKDPVIVLKYIASGFFGRTTAYSGDTLMPFWGLLFHYAIAFSWTIIFFFACSKIKPLLMNRVASGLLYGIFIWAVMSQIIVPLSNAPKLPFNIGQAAIGIAILMLAVGLPISFIVNKYYRSRQDGKH